MQSGTCTTSCSFGLKPDFTSTRFHVEGDEDNYRDRVGVSHAGSSLYSLFYYLQIALILGIPALILQLMLFYRVLSAGWRTIRRFDERGSTRRFDDNGVLSLGLLATIVAYLVQAMFNIDVIMVAPYFWLLLGLAYGEFVLRE